MSIDPKPFQENSVEGADLVEVRHTPFFYVVYVPNNENAAVGQGV